MRRNSLTNAYGFGKVIKHSGFIRYEVLSAAKKSAQSNSSSNKPTMLETSQYLPPFEHLIFARQKLLVLGDIVFNDTNDRIADVLHFLLELAEQNTLGRMYFGDVYIEYPDTEIAKPIAGFCKKFTVPVRNVLRKHNYLSKKQNALLPYLHLMFEQGDKCIVGVSMPNDRSIHLLGVHRLKFPAKAPSRSTLKLEEAMKTFCNLKQQSALFHQGMSAVDLGACPGGWTYQLVTRGIRVEAVDNGKMDESLLETGLVDYAPADGFLYRPKDGHVDWLVCDMIEQPDRVAKLMLEWLKLGLCSAAIFNLKLPMKQRYMALRPLIDEFESFRHHEGQQIIMHAKHLYHNRDEVSFFIIKNSVMCAEFVALQEHYAQSARI